MTLSRALFLWIFAGWLGVTTHSQAAEQQPFAKIILTELTQSINLVKTGYTVHDPEQRWSMQAFRNNSAPWRQLLREPNSAIAAMGGQYWLILEIENATQQTQWYLNFLHSRTDDIEVLVRTEGQPDQYLRSGMAHPPSSKPLPGPGHVFPVTLAAKSTQLLLIKARSTLFEGSLYVQLDTAPHHSQHYGNYQTMAVLYVGIMLALALYNLFVFFGTGDRIYLWYMLSGLCITLTWGSYFGVVWQLTGFNDASRYFAALTQLGSALFALLFTRDFLNIAADHPLLNRLYNTAIVLLGITLAACPFVHAGALFAVYWISILPLSLLMLSSSVWRMMEGYRAARFIIAGHGLVTLGLFATGLSYLRVVPYDAPQPLAFANASAVEMLLFGVAMADRIKQLHHAKLSAEQATEVKSAFLAIMSHEIRTPLAGLLGIVRLLANTALNPTQRKLVNTVGYSGDALLSLLNDTLDYSRMKANRLDILPQDFDLRLLVDSLVLLMEGRASEKGLILTSQVDPQLPQVLRGDVNRIRQILINLLANAIKFTDRGIVKLQVERAGPVDNSGGTVRFMVIDSGIGMPTDVQQHIFSPFNQGRDIQRRFGGAGLGLSISRDLARAMSGDISVDSLEGRGSTFYLDLPLVQGNSSIMQLPLDPQTPPATARSIGSLRLLVVDDAEINRIAAKGLLEQEGHRVIVAHSAEEALHLLSRQDVDWVLMDIHMPGMDGATAIRRIRRLEDRSKRDVGIIALSAWLQEGEEDELLSCGANAVCRKPLEIQVLNAVFTGTRQQEKPALTEAD